MAGADGTIIISSIMQDAGFIGTVNRFIGTLSSFGSKLTKTQALLGSFAITFAAILIPQLIKTGREMVEFETQTAELIKVLDTPGEGIGIARMISRLSASLPVARRELLDVAAQAARLGIRGAANIREFVRVSAMIGVATDLSADQAADAFARIMKQTNSTVREYERMAGTMNSLANQMATTDSEIVESARRAAPDLSRFGLDVNEILALAAALNEVSESSTRAGTRLRMFAQNLTDPNKVQVFADGLGKTREEFIALAESDPRGTLMALIETFREGGREADILAAGLDSRVRLALAALSQNIEGVQRAWKIMEQEATADISSLAKEYGVFANTIMAMDVQIENQRQEIRRRTLGELSMRWKHFVRRTEMFWLGAIAGKEKLDEVVGNTTMVELYEESIESLDRALFASGSTGEQAFLNVGLESDKARHMIDEMWREAIIGADGAESAMISFANVMNRVQFQKMGITGLIEAEGDIRHFMVQLTALFDVIQDRSMEGGKEFALYANGIVEGLLLFARAGASIEQLRTALLEGLSLINNWKPATEGAKTATDQFIAETEELIQKLREQVAELRGGELAAVKLTDAWINASPTQKETIERLIRIKEALEAQIDRQKKAAAAIKEHTEFLKKFNEAARERINDARRDREAARDRIADIEAEAEAIRSLQPDALVRLEREREIIRIWKEGIAAGRSLALIHEEINATMALWSAQDYAEQQKALNEETKTLGELLRENEQLYAQTVAEAQFDLITDALQEMGNAAGDVFDALIGKTDKLGDAVVDMIQRIARAAFEAKITQLLFNLLAGLGGSAYSNIRGIDYQPTPVLDRTGAGVPLHDPVTTWTPSTSGFTPGPVEELSTDDFRVMAGVDVRSATFESATARTMALSGVNPFAVDVRSATFSGATFPNATSTVDFGTAQPYVDVRAATFPASILELGDTQPYVNVRDAIFPNATSTVDLGSASPLVDVQSGVFPNATSSVDMTGTQPHVSVRSALMPNTKAMVDLGSTRPYVDVGSATFPAMSSVDLRDAHPVVDVRSATFASAMAERMDLGGGQPYVDVRSAMFQTATADSISLGNTRPAISIRSAMLPNVTSEAINLGDAQPLVDVRSATFPNAMSETMNLGAANPLVNIQTATMLDPTLAGTIPRMTQPNFDQFGQIGKPKEQMQEQIVIENHYHTDIQALDGPSVRQILVRERDTVAGITLSQIQRSRTLKKTGVH